MPSSSKTAQPRDEIWMSVDSAAIRKRLFEFVGIKFGGNWSRFARALGLSVQTVIVWKTATEGWPSFQHLWKLAENRLSIDWLISGRGPMQLERSPAETDAGKLLELLRPHAQRQADVTEFAEEQAFYRILIDYGVGGTLSLAASAFVPKYLEVQRDLKEVDNTSKLSAAFHASLTSIDHAVGVRDASETAKPSARDAASVRKALQETMKRIEDAIPGWLRAQAVNLKWNQEKMNRANQLMQEATAKGWHPYALTTAAEVAGKVSAAEDAVRALSELAGQANPQVVNQLANIAHMLDQLRMQVAALQTQHEETATTTTAPAARKKAKPRRRKSST